MGSDKARTKPHYEFMGPPGAIFIMLSLPLTTYALYFICNRDQCMSFNPYSPSFLAWHNPLTTFKSTPSSSSSSSPSWLDFFFSEMISLRGSLLYLGWFFYQVLLYYILPSPVMKGTKLIDPKTNQVSNAQLDYPLNGFAAMWVGIGTAIGLVYAGVFPPTVVYDEFLPLITTSILFCFALSCYLYFSSLLSSHSTPQTQLAPHGHTGNHIYDFFIGRDLNPRLFGLDLKYFCELRPGLIGWVLIDLSFAAQQYKEIGSITNSMVLILIFQFVYVVDALSAESAILTTMDITSDGFGFMLVFGDLCWVPFTYSLQARYLVEYPLTLSYFQISLVLLVKLIGFLIFRGTNNQKNEFRTNPTSSTSRSMKYLTTESGSKLLISGYWGWARHLNYFGDLLMGLSWCLPCGWSHSIPYFYSVYFTVLLVHRERRDDVKCREKYKKDWEKYCQIVPYRIVPYVY